MSGKSVTNLVGSAVLRAMSASFNYRGSVREQMRSNGSWTDMTVGIRTENRSVEQGIRFRDGKAKVMGRIPADVDVTLPKFTFESEFLLRETLEAMGMTVPFSPAADFTGMRESGGLSIDEAFHKTFIDLNEKGVEAAAATAVVMNDAALPPPPETFTADRPFLFLIRDRSTGAVLFLGRLMDPSA